MVKNIAFIPLQQNHSTELRKIDGPAKIQSHRGKQSMLLALTECLRGESHLPACFAESPLTWTMDCTGAVKRLVLDSSQFVVYRRSTRLLDTQLINLYYPSLTNSVSRMIPAFCMRSTNGCPKVAGVRTPPSSVSTVRSPRSMTIAASASRRPVR